MKQALGIRLSIVGTSNQLTSSFLTREFFVGWYRDQRRHF